MKRTVCLLLVSLLCVLCLAAAAEEAGEQREEFTVGDYTYALLDDGTAEIIGYNGSAETLDIPAELDGKRVTRIGDVAFSWCNGLMTSVTIPDSVTEIGRNPFINCDVLTGFRVSPDHPALAVIDGVLFSKADRRLVCYPAGLGSDAYTIPQGIEIISDSAFWGCGGLTSIAIPDSVTEIGDSAFGGCRGLTSIAIPGSVTEIGDSAFESCSGLTSVAIPDSVTRIGEYAFSGCGSLTSVAIPGSVTEIGKYAFFRCIGLTSVAIPDSVTEIGSNPFIWCDTLTGFRVSPDHPALVVIDGVLFSKADRRLVCYPFGLDSDAYTIPQRIEIIGDSAFYVCSGLTSIAIPDGVTEIGDYAFYNCSGLTSIAIPGSVTRIGDSAFSYCGGLTSVAIPGSVTEIGEDAFSKCDQLTLTVGRDSFAKEYCVANGLNYTDPGANDWLTN